jgi:hypothetical protein
MQVELTKNHFIFSLTKKQIIMKTSIFQYPEIVKLNIDEINHHLLNKIFEIETYSKDDDKETKFIAEIIDFTLTPERKLFSLEIQVEGELSSKELLILNVKSMKFIRGPHKIEE